jgi:hypothetical protein
MTLFFAKLPKAKLNYGTVRQYFFTAFGTGAGAAGIALYEALRQRSRM